MHSDGAIQVAGIRRRDHFPDHRPTLAQTRSIASPMMAAFRPLRSLHKKIYLRRWKMQSWGRVDFRHEVATIRMRRRYSCNPLLHDNTSAPYLQAEEGQLRRSRQVRPDKYGTIL